ncbi:glycosyltransferase family 4 protein [Sphingosinicella humi]|uniref:Glycosyl transferase group 1 n=1 Tax=Allosphingosinicella humi TaxID=2068657 RepID=A0A2U2J506_9SPHN|nr:glycosyltransferase family 4 protein [Sphingosinicella humi]PWG03429.1 glycosyl transferase group 1 [Sphingosinicella humi]
MKSIRVAYVAVNSPYRLSSWSGIPHFALKELSRRFSDLHVIDTPWLDARLDRLSAAIRIGIMPMREPLVTRLFERILNSRLAAIKPDILVSIGAAHKVSRISPNLPLIHVSDGMFSTVIGYYPRYLGLSSRSREIGRDVQADVVRRASAIAVASDWAAHCASEEYPCAASKIHVVPLGANLETPPAAAPPRTVGGPLKLLFVGYDWKRKGGDVVLSVFKRLRAHLKDAELHIVGCSPREARGVAGVVQHGQLRKDVPEQQRKLVQLFTQANFLFVPSRYETYGLVFCEASAFGLPSITVRTGGIPTIIKDGVNGLLFSPEASVETYVERILRCWRDADGYDRLQRAARSEYETRLNWRSWGASIQGLIDQAVEAPPSAGERVKP